VPAISNASPIIHFAKIGRLEILHRLFGEILVPSPVMAEIRVRGDTDPEVDAITAAPWMNVVTIDVDTLSHEDISGLDRGEAAVIALALAVAAEEDILVILDDLRGRKAARRHGLGVIGSAGNLVLARNRGVIDLVRPDLDALIDAGMYMRRGLYLDILRGCGELQAHDT
jgi:uncharacterized protein